VGPWYLLVLSIRSSLSPLFLTPSFVGSKCVVNVIHLHHRESVGVSCDGFFYRSRSNRSSSFAPLFLFPSRISRYTTMSWVSHYRKVGLRLFWASLINPRFCAVRIDSVVSLLVVAVWLLSGVCSLYFLSAGIDFFVAFSTQGFQLLLHSSSGLRRRPLHDLLILSVDLFSSGEAVTY